MDSLALKVLVIIPAHNESGSLPSVLAELEQYRDHYDAVVIDDASTDQTAEISKSFKVPTIRLAANLGIGGAVQAGYKYALQNDYDVAIQLDGDGQHNPAWIERLLIPIASGEADCVIGSRYLKENPDREYKTPRIRRAGMFFSTAILLLATGKIVTDTTSGFRALNRPVLQFFAREYPPDHPEAEALLMLLRKGFVIKEVPVKMRSRQTGTSLFTLLRAVKYPIRVLIGFLGLLIQKKDK
jgi:glycosyltransferase involved in cell wall biosynthesis